LCSFSHPQNELPTAITEKMVDLLWYLRSVSWIF
jgi:hypothetical protein